ncbi:hypothetical protein F4604DRAFT_1687141 [Suillus subluteus]|nr:hypothetical protein F4604DRAFT_1687141 [Suillus subluteus]
MIVTLKQTGHMCLTKPSPTKASCQSQPQSSSGVPSSSETRQQISHVFHYRQASDHKVEIVPTKALTRWPIFWFQCMPAAAIQQRQCEETQGKSTGSNAVIEGGRSFRYGALLAFFKAIKKQIRLLIGKCPCSILFPQMFITPALIASSIMHPYVLTQLSLVVTSAILFDHIEMPSMTFAKLDIVHIISPSAHLVSYYQVLPPIDLTPQ